MHRYIVSGILMAGLGLLTTCPGEVVSSKGELDQLSFEEKVNLCHGNVTTDAGKRFDSGGIERLGIRQLASADGPMGVRTFDDTLPSTALPSTLSLSCTWNRAAAQRYADIIADEMLAYNKQVLFGPGANLMRSPLGGRNFEYMGEDPFLTGVMGVEYIQAVQKKRVAACVKHYLANSRDDVRHFNSSNMDERTLREMYLVPFEMAVTKANVWTLMTGNNLFDGVHVSENKRLVQGILKNELGFDGVVFTDWRAAYTAEGAANAGTDITSGLCAYVFGDTVDGVLDAVRSGKVSEAVLDDKVRRILRLYDRTGLLGNTSKQKGSLNTEEHKTAARELAAEGMVLLKNEKGILPVRPESARRILITGPAADTVSAGTGSSLVKATEQRTPLKLLTETYSTNRLTFVPYEQIGSKAVLPEVDGSDVVLFFARGPASGEGKDLKALELPDYQSDAISALAARNPHVVVIVMSASAVDMTPWVDHVAGILMAWYPGQAGGDAIADIVSGRCSPSGKLSFTMARMLDDYACHSLGAWDLQPHFPDPPTVAPHKKEERHPIHGYDSNYAEGLLVGYRWFDAKAVEPLFPFGFGLSYTTFKLSGGHLEIIDSSKDSPEILAMVDVCNTGECRGAETVQVYVEDCSASVQRPVRELKGFEKVFLYPGETKTVSIPLDFRSFAFWDDSTHCWMIEPGEFLVHQGTSSRDFSCSLPVVLGKR